MKIAILTSRKSETDFYRLLADNKEIQLKHLCRKVPRTMVYRYLKQLQQIQQETETDLFTASAHICRVTGLPTKQLTFKAVFKIKDIGDRQAIVTINTDPNN